MFRQQHHTSCMQLWASESPIIYKHPSMQLDPRLHCLCRRYALQHPAVVRIHSRHSVAEVTCVAIRP